MTGDRATEPRHERVRGGGSVTADEIVLDDAALARLAATTRIPLDRVTAHVHGLAADGLVTINAHGRPEPTRAGIDLVSQGRS